MQRRKFMIGVGSLAAGSAAAMGTGAFSQATVSDREMTVQIADTDETGAIGLIPGQTQAAFINEKGELEVDLNHGMGDGAEGMNPNSTYYFGGEFNDNLDYEEGVTEDELQNNPPVFDRPLFSVKNQSTEDRRIEATLDLINAPDGCTVTALAFQYSGVEQATLVEVDTDNPTDSAAQFNLSPGHQFDFVMIVESGSASGALEMELSIEANAQR